MRDSEAAKALFEKVGLFKTPELLEKYLIASEVTVEVLDLFLSRILGTERASIEGGDEDLKAILESFCSVSLSDQKGSAEKVSARTNEPNKEVEGLRVKVQDLERQLCAVQRQLQMQGEVSELAASLDGRLAEIRSECERQVSDVRAQVSTVSNDVIRLNQEVSEMARTGEVKELTDAVSRLKEDERRIGDRISEVQKAAKEAERVLRDEIQGEIKSLKAVTSMIPIYPLNGIIAQLTRECGGNVHQKGFVEVTASSVRRSDCDVRNAVELGTDAYFATKDESDRWLCYDFKERRVAPTSYSIRSDNGWYLKSWDLEVSNDRKTWKVVDRRENNSHLKAVYVTRNFTISEPPLESFRYIRLHMTNKTHGGDDILALSSLEIFGRLSRQ